MDILVDLIFPVVVLFGIIVAYPWLKNQMTNTNNNMLTWTVQLAVTAAEQQLKGKSGEEKLAYATACIVDFANKHGIKITEKHIRMLIEAAVKVAKPPTPHDPGRDGMQQ